MGEVYLAEDVRLRRKAALKLLPDQYTADPERLRRFEQEARAVSALNHPNIVTIYAVGQSGSTHFLAAEYVEGSTLRERLAAGKLGLPAVLDIAAQTAAALAAAHAAGVVHRDIKPENIMVRPDGLVKVLDFGLAKLAEKARAGSDFRTDPGAVMGTPAYMSPEQARGFEVGLPSDVFSLGSVIYEMLAGQPAFTGPSPTDVLAAVIGKEPPAIDELRDGAPQALVRVITRALEKDPGKRYQSAQEMLSDLKSCQRDPGSAANRRLNPTQRLWLFAAALLIMAVVIGLAGRGRFFGRHSIKSIAVMPFDNLSKNAEQEWFSDGMTETLITELSKVRVLKVISRTSVMQYKGARKPLKQIAGELGVDAIIEGSALRVGDRVRITAQLIEASTDLHLWGKDYDREVKDALSIHREVAGAIAREVGATLAPVEKRLAPQRAVNPDAMEAYLKGLYQYNRGEVENSIDLAREAIRLDPELAAAHELPGTSLDRMAGMHKTSYSAIVQEASAELRRALEIEPDRPGAISALGIILMEVDHNWQQAETALRRGFELDSSVGLEYGYLLAARGRLEEAIQVGRAAIQRDPASPLNLTDMGHLYYHARHYGEAIVWFRKALDLKPNFFYPHYFLPITYLLAGQPDQAFDAWLAWLASNRAGKTPGLRDHYRGAYQKGGWPAVWRVHLERFPGITDNTSAAVRSRLRAYLFLGEKSKALDELDNLEKLADGWLTQLQDPIYDPVRQELRFKALLKRLKYPESMWAKELQK